MSSGVRVGSWWAKAWLRAVEEAAYDPADLSRARGRVRAGAVGVVAVETGSLHASVHDGVEPFRPRVTVPLFGPEEVQVVLEAMTATVGRLPVVLAGDLPHDLVEHCDELGAELLPAGGDLESECRCASWLPVCPHALALLVAFARDLDTAPRLLLELRGVDLDDGDGGDPSFGPDLEVAWQASREASEMLDRPSPRRW